MRYIKACFLFYVLVSQCLMASSTKQTEKNDDIKIEVKDGVLVISNALCQAKDNKSISTFSSLQETQTQTTQIDCRDEKKQNLTSK